MKIRSLVLSTLCLSVVGCRCGTKQIDTLPEYVVNPPALSFEACPIKDEQGKAVADVAPDEQQVTVTNRSKTGGGLKLTISGEGAAAYSTAFKPADAGTPSAIDAFGELEVPIRFAPLKKGSAKAQLVISDETEDTADLKVDLVGTGSDMAAQPTIKVSVLDSTSTYQDCLEGVICLQSFADTLYKESVTLDVKITNTGCPALKITGLEITPVGGAGNLAYFIDAPSVLPTELTPLVLTQADDLQTTRLKIRFAPEDDASGNDARFAILRIKTNDPNARDSDNNVGGFDMQLSGTALKPAIDTSPSKCAFSEPDTCGNPVKVDGKANFLVKNQGNVAIKIDSTVFKSNSSQTAGQDNRFTITGTPLKDVVIMPGASAPFEVSHTEMPLYIQDLLTISASVSPAGAVGSAGRAVLSLSGGKKPCLSTIPAMDGGQAVLDFGDPVTELSAKEVTIKNGPAATCGDLIITGVSVENAPNPFFSLLDPMIPAGTKITPGNELRATVQYKKPVLGGDQYAVLRIGSNDSSFDVRGYPVLLQNKSQLNQIPVAVLKACVPSDAACTMPKTSVNLSTLPAGPNGTRLITITGRDSYDPQPDGGQAKPLALYRFRLVSAPSNATTHKFPADGLKDAGFDAELQLDGVVSGLYKVSLDVWDSTNLQSGAGGVVMNLNVLQ